MSDLQDLHEELGEAGVAVFGLNIPSFGEDPNTLIGFREQAGLTYPLLDHAETGWAIDFVAGSATAPYPRQVIVDQQSVIVHTALTYDPEGLRAIVDGLLATSGP